MRSQGFTLMELLMVIAIIAILAAILFPIFLSTKEHAKVTRCLSNLSNLQTALRLYADDNGGKMPSATYAWMSPDWCGNIAWNGDTILEKGSIWAYTKKSRGIFLCPSDRGIAPYYIPNNRNYPLSYTMNYALHLSCLDSIAGPSRMLTLIHEGRDTIDDACFYWKDDGSRNLPSYVHYTGSTAVYFDGHAKWVSYNALRKQRIDNWWDPFKQK